MPMTLAIPDEIAHSAQETAASTGTSVEQILLQALQAPFPSVPPELQAEFDAWEPSSDEDMARLDAEEGMGWV